MKFLGPRGKQKKRTKKIKYLELGVLSPYIPLIFQLCLVVFSSLPNLKRDKENKNQTASALLHIFYRQIKDFWYSLFYDFFFFLNTLQSTCLSTNIAIKSITKVLRKVRLYYRELNGLSQQGFHST